MSCNSAKERVFVSFTLQEVPMRPAALDTRRGKWEPCVNSLAADHVAQPPSLYEQRSPPSSARAHTCTHIHTQPTIKLVLQHKFSKNVLWWAPKQLFRSWPSAWSTTCLCFKTLVNGNWCKKITVGTAMEREWLVLVECFMSSSRHDFTRCFRKPLWFQSGLEGVQPEARKTDKTTLEVREGITNGIRGKAKEGEVLQMLQK